MLWSENIEYDPVYFEYDWRVQILNILYVSQNYNKN